MDVQIKKTIAVAMSGGVDSAVAAALLKKQGHNVLGVFMEVFDESFSTLNGSYPACFGPDERRDLQDAKKVAEQLKIPLFVIDLKQEYKTGIIDFVVSGYSRGFTPNPCIKCNKELKFRAISNELKKRKITFDFFATGHYAQVEYSPDNKTVFLKKAIDLKKDQSYFLYHLKDRQLEKIIFPLGKLKKEETRNLARKFNLDVSTKKESQDFIAGGYRQLFKYQTPGPILNVKNEVIGEHRGLPFYTIGQRRGIGLSGLEPLYVLRKEKKRNALIVGDKNQLLGDELIARDLNWVNFDELTGEQDVKARIRYQHEEALARVRPIKQNRVLVKFNHPQSAISPGQAIVFYRDDVVLGGGIIEKEVKNESDR